MNKTKGYLCYLGGVNLKIVEKDPSTADAILLMDELSERFVLVILRYF